MIIRGSESGDILRIHALWQFYIYAKISQLLEASQFCRYVGVSWLTPKFSCVGGPTPTTLGIYFFFSFFNFRFSFGLSWAFFCCSLLPLSFFPLSPISVSPCLKVNCAGVDILSVYFYTDLLGGLYGNFSIDCHTPSSVKTHHQCLIIHQQIKVIHIK